LLFQKSLFLNKKSKINLLSMCQLSLPYYNSNSVSEYDSSPDSIPFFVSS
jgi:hypothetical protein